MCIRDRSTKQAINDKLHGSVATYLRCSGVFNNQIKKCLLLSLRVNFFLIGEYLAKLQAKHNCLVHLLRLLAVCWPSAQRSGLALNLPNIHLYEKIALTHLAINLS